MSRHATLKNRVNNEVKQVPIASPSFPNVSKSIIKKWQALLDMTIRLLNVPSGLIMRLHEDCIEVFVSGNGERNTYRVGDVAKLQTGLYCEAAICANRQLLVPML
jgi:hypothetical protein